MTTTVVHIKKDSYTYYIGRGSKFGNIFTHLPLHITKAEIQVQTREDAIAAFEIWFCTSDDPRAKYMRDNIDDLRDHVLGCFCAPESCHGHILARYADLPAELRPWNQKAI